MKLVNQHIIRFLGTAMFVSFGVNAMSQTTHSLMATRPGQAMGPFTAGKGLLVFQHGFDIAGSRTSTSTYHEYKTNHFVRYGLSERTEIHMLLELKQAVRDDQAGGSGFSSPYFGVTSHIRDGNGWDPHLAFHAGTYLPAGSDSFRLDKLAPVLTLITQQSPSSWLSFTTNQSLYWDGFSSRPGYKYVAGMAFSMPHGWGIFMENYGSWIHGSFGTWIDGGMAWMPGKNIQLDLFGGYGSNQGQQDFFISLGISWRLNRGKDLYLQGFQPPRQHGKDLGTQ